MAQLTHLSLFAVERQSGKPLRGLPFYAEVEALTPVKPPPITGGVANAGLFSEVHSVDPKDVLFSRVVQEAVLGSLSKESLDKLAASPQAEKDGFASDLFLTAAGIGLPAEPSATLLQQALASLRDLPEDALRQALLKGVRLAASRRQLTLAADSVAKSAYPLGVLATDHVGYLSFDLTRLPLAIRQAISKAVEVRSGDPAATLDVSIKLYTLGSDNSPLDALGQSRFAEDAILTRIEFDGPLPAGSDAVGYLSMQNPSLTDWRLSAASFAANRLALLGDDQGCENILPAHVALQEYYFYQVFRLTDIEPPVAPVIPAQVQLGLVNEYRVSWNPLGHSLGQIIYSLPLAPGESVNLTVIDWTRRDEAQRKERTTVDEQLVHNEHRDRTISEAVNTAVSEYQHGSNFTGGIAGGLGGSSSSGSGGIAGSLGGSTSSTSGTRDITGSTVQKLSDNITQVSSSLRELQSTVVVQSTQSEKEAIETRTVVNYNHSHALTILYYEMLRHFRVVTELTRQRPAVLVKFRTDWFDGQGKALNTAKENILANRAVLADALLDSRFAGSFDALDRASHGPFPDFSTDLPKAVAPLPPAGPGPPFFHYFTFEMRAGNFIRDVLADDQRADILADLLLKDGRQISLRNSEDSTTLNYDGSFRIENSNNIFTAVPQGGGTIAWADITGLVMLVSVHPTDDPKAKVSFSHIKVFGIDEFGPPGVVLIDESYEKDGHDGHIIIRNFNKEQGRKLTLPTRRPAVPPASPPPFSAADASDRAQSIALIAHLNAHKSYYSRSIALAQNTHERANELDSVRLADNSTALQHLDNRPLEVVGDYLAYPGIDPAWNQLILSKTQLPNGAADASAVLDERLVTLPTRGVFAEAKLGHCNASERIDNTRFWDWQQSPIPHFAPEIAAAVPVTPQPQQTNLAATPFPSPIVNIVNPPNAPDPTGLADAFKVLGTPNIFRDLSGAQEVAQLLQTLANDAVAFAKGASGAGAGGVGGSKGSGAVSSGAGAGIGGGASTIGGPRALPNQPSAGNVDLQHFGNVLADAQEKGLITPEAAQQAFANVLSGATSQQEATPETISASDAQSVGVVSVRISFAGSFQCRLATDPSPPDAPRAAPNKNQGYTFDFGEAPFDRIIRLQAPVELRSALIEPFVPVAVTAVAVRAYSFSGANTPYQQITDSVLLGAPVSFGSSAKFDTAAGGEGPSFEAILGAETTFGSFFKVTPKADPKLIGVSESAATKVEYLSKKPAVVVAANATNAIVPPRAAVLANKDRLAGYSRVFSFSEDAVPVLTDMTFLGAPPPEVFKPTWSWELALSFSRFDGDTLVGRVSGTLTGTPPPGEA